MMMTATGKDNRLYYDRATIFYFIIFYHKLSLNFSHYLSENVMGEGA